ncbi:MAG: hypothetical protein DRO92_03335 [Candidatus Altiarchaeales archaeon]|nr:MAG: hypothetical protein DRO92_03335 [Candidatus Altiarchaeales archaeon]
MPITNFTYPVAFVGFLLLIPLIILYLLKPKPKHIRIPTIMFIYRIEKEKRFSSFFKRFIRDPILILQIIIISLIILAIAKPFIIGFVEENPTRDIVIIIDSSASMQSKDVYPNRFSNALEIASSIINSMNDESRVNIILAGGIPIQLVSNSDRDTGLLALWKAKCSDSPTNIKDSMAFAIDILSGYQINKNNERVNYIISDFSSVEKRDVDLYRKLALNRNISVEFIKVAKNGNNIGLIFADIKRFPSEKGKFHITFNVKNFNDKKEKISIDILVDNNKVKSINEDIDSFSEKLIKFDIDASEDSHFIGINLKLNDDFTIDNNVVLYLPQIKKYNVLLITNDGADNFLRYAIEASPNVDLKKALFPIIPDFYPFDVVIIGEFDRNLSIPGVFKELERYVKNGGNLIVISSDSINDKNIKNLLPVILKTQRIGKKQIDIVLKHKILKDVLVSNLIVKKYFETSEKNGSTVIARIGDSPVISYMKFGKGKIFFLGINPSPEWSNFYLSSSLPIFCYQLIKWINSEESQIINHNFKSGEYLVSLKNVTIETPSGIISKSRNLLLDEIGIYRINYTDTEREDIVAVNLLNEKESDISNSPSIWAYKNEFVKRGRVYQKKQELSLYLIILVLIFILFETILYRRRGKI